MPLRGSDRFSLMTKPLKTLLILVLLGMSCVLSVTLLSKLRTQREMLSNTEQEIEQLRNKLEDENARKSKADADGLARNAELMALRAFSSSNLFLSCSISC